MRTFLALLSLLALASCAERVAVTNCDNGEVGELIEVLMSEKKIEDGRIILKRGYPYDFIIKFKAGQNSDSLVTKLSAVIYGVDVPLEQDGSNACSSLTEGKCPLVSCRVYTYSNSLLISPIFNIVPFMLRWSLVSKDANNKLGSQEICFEIPARTSRK